MAGGIVLLSVMLLFLEPLVAIPLHGIIQLVSNGSRAVVQRRHVDREILWRYALLLLPAGFLGLAIAERLSPPVARALIGVFVLAATWAPGLLMLGTHPERVARGRRFVLLGGVVGVLNMTVGATGPLIAPFFLNLGLTRQSLVGTKAACTRNETDRLSSWLVIVLWSVCRIPESRAAVQPSLWVDSETRLLATLRKSF